MNLYPFDEVAAAADERIQAGATVYQQFNCAGCGAKQTIDTPNTFHTLGTCEECGHTSDLVRDGCNYMLTWGVPQP
jgi:hypothetical protein